MTVDPNIFKEHVEKNLEELRQQFKDYNISIDLMGGDVPLSALCLPKALLRKLELHNFVRVYDFYSKRLIEIEWLDDSDRRLLASRLNEFFPVHL